MKKHYDVAVIATDPGETTGIVFALLKDGEVKVTKFYEADFLMTLEDILFSILNQIYSEDTPVDEIILVQEHPTIGKFAAAPARVEGYIKGFCKGIKLLAYECGIHTPFSVREFYPSQRTSMLAQAKEIVKLAGYSSGHIVDAMAHFLTWKKLYLKEMEARKC